jgi:hypothetical protein
MISSQPSQTNFMSVSVDENSPSLCKKSSAQLVPAEEFLSANIYTILETMF